MVAAAEKNVAAAGFAMFRRVFVQRMPDANMEPFDAAISRLMLMLVPDPVAAARAVLAVLRPGGAFSAIVPGDQGKVGSNAIVLDILARHGGKQTGRTNRAVSVPWSIPFGWKLCCAMRASPRSGSAACRWCRSWKVRPRRQR